MKKLVVIVACLLPLSIMAQKEFKFGHINVQEIYETMSEEEANIKSQVAKVAKMYEEEILKMTPEYEAKVADFQNNMQDKSEDIKRKKLDEIQDLEKRIKEYYSSGQQAVLEKEQELIAEISKKIATATQAVGKKNGYTYIFNLGNDVVYASEQSTDVTNLVKKELAGEKTPAPAAKK